MSDLDRRAAEAMGWEDYSHDHHGRIWREQAPSGKTWRDPTTDANACRELLEEVKRRGLVKEFDFDFKPGASDFYLHILTTDLSYIVQVAVGVLEAAAPPTERGQG